MTTWTSTGNTQLLRLMHAARLAQLSAESAICDGGPGFITYDDAFSTFYRVWYTDWQRGLGGTFIWELDADYDGHSQDLLDAAFNATQPQTK